MDHRIFIVQTDVNACDCIQWCTDTVRESALKVDSGRKIPCGTGESNLRQQRAGPTLYQLGYIPTVCACLCTCIIFNREGLLLLSICVVQKLKRETHQTFSTGFKVDNLFGRKGRVLRMARTLSPLNFVLG